MQTAYLLIGGNLGNIQQNLHTAIDFINKECGTIVKQSSIYKTAAWGLTEQPDFLNQVLVLQTDLVPEKLMHQLLLIDDLVLTSDLLTVPHPALPQRRFALAPLNEVAAHVIHPVKKKTIHTLLLNCTDSLDVQKISASA